ncbi:MAG: hypothetical protein EOS25_20895 [Mesorhizobium sp.]|uniref:hypothetical protein n=1 Tax=Mesorhizobium sp. TaxID=1871066 RepID=UPI000FE51F8E|nr:hypothetical protein [Mesorhizobium sp.]RWD50849.1 MAG: hypothetical protein EOS59_07580 [Mesorhizobium sp.]RWF09207.1 MAG: hypothetical protein EOS69_20500 [Mesorhizobium sp.]RWF16227.1 MAG: hypothetical protein EOS25_20895 [Mesorhizobium sp.]TIY06483.1 MAG: hypothetical protein E5V22_03045 [Mesorhizobium sp.]
MKNAAVGLFCLASLSVSAITSASGQPAKIYNDKYKAATYLNTRSDSEASKKFLYKTARLAIASGAWDRDRSKAHDIIKDYVAIAKLNQNQFLPLTKKRFMQLVSEDIEYDLNGMRLSDLEIAKVAGLGIAAGSALLFKRADVGEFIASVGGSSVGEFFEYTSKLTTIRSPIKIKQISLERTIDVLELAEELAKDDPLFAQYYIDAMKHYAQMNSISEAERKIEWKTFEQGQEIIGINYSIDQLESSMRQVKGDVNVLNNNLESTTRAIKEHVKEQAKQADDLAAKEKYLADKLAYRERVRQREEQLDAEFLTQQGILTVMSEVGKRVGAPPEAIRRIEQVRNANSAVYDLLSVLNSPDPRKKVLGWQNLALTALDLLLPSNGAPNDGADLLEAITSLSEQIDDLDRDVEAGFERLEHQLSTEFAEVRSLVELTVSYHQKQIAALTQARKEIASTSFAVVSYIEEKFAHEENVFVRECFSLSPDEIKHRRRCALYGLVLASDTSFKPSYNRKSVNQWFDEINALATKLERTNAFLSGFGSVTHLYSTVHPANIAIPNPDSFMYGIGLMLEAIRQNPRILREDYMADWRKVLEVGSAIQRFFRLAFSEEQPDGKYKVSGKLIVEQYKRYQKVSISHAEAIAGKMSEVNFPWYHTDQVLPTETVLTDAQWEMTKRRESGDRAAAVDFVAIYYKGEVPSDAPAVDVVNVGRKLRIPTGRGYFSDSGEAVRHPFLTDRVKYCPEVKETILRDPSGPNDYALEHMLMPDIRDFRTGRGVALLDKSALVFVPREALWLNLIKPARYKLSACVSRIYAFMDHLSAESFYNRVYNSDIRLALDIKFRLDDVERQKWVYVSSASMSMAVMAPSEIVNSDFMVFRDIFNGKEYKGVAIGGISNNWEYYFVPAPLPDQSEALKDMQQAIKLERNQAIQRVLVLLSDDEAEITARAAEEEYRKLALLPLIGSGGVPEVDVMMRQLSEDLGDVSPDEVVERSLNGANYLSVISAVRQRGEEIEQMVEELQGRLLTVPPRTPVDGAIAELLAYARIEKLN